MGIADPLILLFTDGHAKPWWLKRGRETFFANLTDRNWNHLRWATAEEAIAWAQQNLGKTPVAEGEAHDQPVGKPAGRSDLSDLPLFRAKPDDG